MISKILYEKLITNFSEAYRVVKTNKVRTFLTALGIIFGVAAVITMLAIGSGAEKEILSQLELVGVNNIVITPIPDEEDDNEESEDGEGSDSNESGVNRFSKGLDLLDVYSISEALSTVKFVSPEIIMNTYVINKGRQNKVKLIGVNSSFFQVNNSYNNYSNISTSHPSNPVHQLRLILYWAFMDAGYRNLLSPESIVLQFRNHKFSCFFLCCSAHLVLILIFYCLTLSRKTIR